MVSPDRCEYDVVIAFWPVKENVSDEVILNVDASGDYDYGCDFLVCPFACVIYPDPLQMVTCAACDVFSGSVVEPTRRALTSYLEMWIACAPDVKQADSANLQKESGDGTMMKVNGRWEVHVCGRGHGRGLSGERVVVLWVVGRCLCICSLMASEHGCDCDHGCLSASTSAATLDFGMGSECVAA